MPTKKDKHWYEDPDFYFVVVIALLAIGSIVAGIIYLPQKWEACGKLYDNAFARILCFSEG